MPSDLPLDGGPSVDRVAGPRQREPDAPQHRRRGRAPRGGTLSGLRSRLRRGTASSTADPATRESWWILGGLAVLVAGYAVLPLSAAVLHVLYLVVAALATAIGFVRGVLVHRPSCRLGWVLVLGGFGGWVLGGLVWQIESWVGFTPLPDPSDGVYLASYGVLAAGVILVALARGVRNDRGAWLDAAIAATGFAVVATVFVILPLWTNGALSVLAKVVSSGYPAGDVVVLAAVALLVISPGARTRSVWLLVGAVLLTTVTDTVWDILVARAGNGDLNRRWVDVGWLAGYVVVAAAATRPSMALVAEPGPADDARPFGLPRIVAIAVGLLLPTAVLLVVGLDGEASRWPAVAAGATVAAVLVLLRLLDLSSAPRPQAVPMEVETDALTGAANRHAWVRELSRACDAARGQHRCLSVATVEIDRFPAFTDTFGQQAADQLLRQVVTAWSDALPVGAVLARLNGERFAVLLPGHDLREAHTVLADLQGRTPLGQSFSAGLAERRESGPDDPSALVAAADRALQRARRDGGDQVVAATTGDLSAPALPRRPSPVPR